MKKALLNAAAAAGLLIAASPALAGSWVAITPVQNSSSTTLFGINNKNILTGSYVDSSGLTHGFVGPYSGTNYTSFDDSGSTTEARALNDKGAITGYDVGTLTPWERSKNGTITNITMNGTTLNQLAQGINNSGTFVANYDNTSGISVGYLGRHAMYKRAIKLSISNNGTAGRAIDTAGDIAGWYLDPTTSLQRGFLHMKGHAPRSIDYPNATYTVVEGMNNNDYLSGQWEDTSGVIHGFIYKISTKKFTDLDVSGASLTQVWGINDHDVVAASSSLGSYIYCVKTCPAMAAGIAKRQQPHQVKYTPAAP